MRGSAHFRWSLGLIVVAVAGGCAGGGTSSDEDAGMAPQDSGSETRDSGTTPMDAGTPRVDATVPPQDAGAPDSGSPGEDCGGDICEPFEYCDSGTCREYPACRGDQTCDSPSTTCHDRRCIPNDVDIDGDGFPAGEDCDETSAMINPGMLEICNGIDDDCVGGADEGDPDTLCESNPGGGTCIEGVCTCPAGFFDLDRSQPGCECEASPAVNEGVSCADAIDLGSLSDEGAGSMAMVTGNVLPDDRDVWYRFRATDTAETTGCDNYHVRARLADNPDDTFEMSVFRGSCTAAAECAGTPGIVDYNWATDFRSTIDGRLTGQCPCSNATEPPTDVSRCQDDTANYFVRVRRTTGSVLRCAGYTLEVSNGLYDFIP